MSPTHARLILRNLHRFWVCITISFCITSPAAGAPKNDSSTACSTSEVRVLEVLSETSVCLPDLTAQQPKEVKPITDAAGTIAVSTVTPTPTQDSETLVSATILPVDRLPATVKPMPGFTFLFLECPNTENSSTRSPYILALDMSVEAQLPYVAAA